MAKNIIIHLAPTIIMMDSSTESFHHHKKTLHSKRSFAKHHSKDSPTYDAQVLLLFHLLVYAAYLGFRSEEDNDPLSTDDGGSSMSIPAISRSAKHPFQSKAAFRARHQLASSMLSDDGTDSQTYDGDVESSVTAAAGSHPFNKTLYPTLQHSSSASTLTSQIDDVLLSSESAALAPDEPVPTAEATSTFNPAALTPEHIQAFIREAIEGKSSRSYKINQPPLNRPVRIFADGKHHFNLDKHCANLYQEYTIYFTLGISVPPFLCNDVNLQASHALQLRQAKLSFPSVHLLVGVNSDEDVVTHKARCVMTHAERYDTPAIHS